MQLRDETSDLAYPAEAVSDGLPPPVYGEDDHVSIDEAAPVGRRSLVEDFEALLSDLRTYYDAELSFQKTRAAFMADALKRTIVYGVVGAFFGMLATIGLAIGLIIALTPLVGPWIATAIVVLILVICAGIFLVKASRSWTGMTDAMRDSDIKGAKSRE